MKCDFLSASGAKTYEGCPLRYYSRYELKNRGSSTIQIDSGLLGHKALEDYYNPRTTLSPEKCFDNAQKENCCADMQEFECAKKMFFDYVLSHPKESYNIIGAEIGFKLFLESGASFRGYIDRMDLIDSETIRILDYKTGRFVPEYSELETAHQTLLYALWVYKHDSFKNIKHVIVEYHYVRVGTEKSIYISRETVNRYEKYIEHLYHSISRDDKPEPRLNTFCYNCDYRAQCPAYQNLVKVFFTEKRDAINPVDFSVSDLISQYELLGIVEKSVKNEKKLIGSMLTNELKYNNLNGKIVGDKKVKLVSRKQPKCHKTTIRDIAKKYKVEDKVLMNVSLKNLQEALLDNAQAQQELAQYIYEEGTAPYPSITTIKKRK